MSLSLILLLRQLSMPRISMLGRLAYSHDFVSLTLHPQATEVARELILRPEEPLFFVNAEATFALARQRVRERPGLRRVILSLEGSPDLDGTALEALSDFATWLQNHGIALRVARLKDGTRELLLRAGLPQLPAEGLEYWSVEDAVVAPEMSAATSGAPATR